ncbi:MAG: hypothetical protein IT341_09270 [Chloroflexi bacterium]|nr:hypothetical protein [Chloroflexota bacterium]
MTRPIGVGGPDLGFERPTGRERLALPRRPWPQRVPYLVTGLDGKHYPMRANEGFTLVELIGRCHTLAHDDALTIRQIVARLAEVGVHRSIGSVSNYLSRWACEACVQVAQKSPPEQGRAS